MILTLIHKNNPTIELTDLKLEFSILKWKMLVNYKVNYISESQANSNNFFNFAIVRHPFLRFVSMYKDMFLVRPNKLQQMNLNIEWSAIEFAKYLNDTEDDQLDSHFKSQRAFLLGSGTDMVYFDLDSLTSLKTNFPKPMLHVHNTKQIPFEFNNLDKLKTLIYTRYKDDYDILSYDPDHINSN